MTYSLIALDIDGTIRSFDHAMSDRTRSAIEAVSERGVVVTLATGRTFRSALAVTAELALTSPIISFQGAHVADPTSGEVLWHRPLTADMALEELDGWDREVLAYLGDRVYADKLTPWVEAYGERNRGLVSVEDDLRSLAPKGILSARRRYSEPARGGGPHRCGGRGRGFSGEGRTGVARTGSADGGRQARRNGRVLRVCRIERTRAGVKGGVKTYQRGGAKLYH